MTVSDKDLGKKSQLEAAVTAVEGDPATRVQAQIRYYEELLDRKLVIESQRLVRVHFEDWKSPSPLMSAFMWASAANEYQLFQYGLSGDGVWSVAVSDDSNCDLCHVLGAAGPFSLSLTVRSNEDSILISACVLP